MSKVALKSNVGVETVRYYERRGLKSKPHRTESGYRMYSEEVTEEEIGSWYVPTAARSIA